MVVGNLGETLLEELNCETVFSIGGIEFAESVVVTWIIMAVVVLASILLTRNLKVEHPGRGQLMLEYVVTWLQDIGKGIVGEEGKQYASYLTSILIYLGIANLIGILGFKPPTKDLNVTAALAIMSIVLIEAAGIRKKRCEAMVEEFYRTGGAGHADQHTGVIYQTIVTLYAVVWKRTRCVCDHETYRKHLQGRASGGVQSLF